MFPYYLRDDFLSPAEFSFYNVLHNVVSEQATICTKVGLADLFYVKRDDPSRYRIYTNKIDRKHVDFLLCDPKTMRPLLGIELDDKSHQRQDRQERDAFVDAVFQAAGLTLLHVPVRRAYRSEDIRALLSPYLSPPTEAPAPLQPAKTIVQLTDVPVCPKCGSMMVLRTARNGANAGRQFWGCPNYPACRTLMSAK
ncbi:MAG: DUF2726 domain-containing protein [Anaerolineae bacterium]|nr:DUF2726 domain-containing protein [Anaerolineae bacterium]